MNTSVDDSYCSRVAFPLASCGCFEPSLSAFPATLLITPSLSWFWWPLVVLGDAGGVCLEGMLKAASERTSAAAEQLGAGGRSSLPSRLLQRAESELAAAAELRRAAEPGQAACAERGAGVGPGWMESGPPAVLR